jgi:hypothetical protein
VFAFGETDAPTSKGTDAASTADTMAAWVKNHRLDGIDIDYQDLSAFNDGSNRRCSG